MSAKNRLPGLPRSKPACSVSLLLIATMVVANSGCDPNRKGTDSATNTRVTAEPVPPSPAPQLRVDRALLEGLDAEVQAAIQSAAAKDLREPANTLNLAMVYHANHLEEAAIAAYQASLNQNSDNAAAWYYLGVCQEGVGDFSAACESWKNCLKAESKLKDAYWRLALVQGEAGDFDAALSTIDAGLQVFPQMQQLLVVKARLLVLDKKFREALEVIPEGTQEQPFHDYVQYLKKLCLAELDSQVERPVVVPTQWVDSTLGELIVHERGLGPKRRMAVQLFDASRHQESLAVLEQVLAKDPTDFRDWNLKAKNHLALEQNALAYEAIQRATKCEGAVYELFMLAGQLALRLNSSADRPSTTTSRQYLEKATQQNPDRWEAYEAMAQLELLDGDPAKALESLAKAVERETPPGQAHLRYVFLLIEQNELEKAEWLIASLPTTFQEDPFMRIARGRILAKSGKVAEAEVILTDLQNEKKDSKFWQGPIEEFKSFLSGIKEADGQ